MNVAEIASAPAITCRPDTDLRSVARLMTQNEVGAVIVADDGGLPVGIVTDRDLGVRALTRGLGAGAPASSVMSHDVVHVIETADIEAAKNLMASWGVRRLPVVDEKGHVRGMITLDDLALAMGEDADRLGHAVRAEIRAGRHGIAVPKPHPGSKVVLP